MESTFGIFINIICCLAISNPESGLRIHIRTKVDVFNLI